MYVDSIESIKEYLARFPYGIHSKEALERIECLKYLSNKRREMDSQGSSGTPNYTARDSFGFKILSAPISIISTPITMVSSGINSVVKAIKDRENQIKHKRPGTTFSPEIESKQTNDNPQVYSSVFAPAEVKHESVLLVQVYLYLHNETEVVKTFAKESQKNAERRDYIPLQCKLKKGDKVEVLLNVYGETLLMSDKKRVVWQGSFTKCSFDYFVPEDIDLDELSCVALLSVNGVPVGEMRFITKIVEYEPRKLNPEIIAHKYSIEPRAELPSDMKENYHFGEV